MSAVRLPATLRHQLTGLALRVRLLRAVRGSSLLALVLAVTAAAMLLADYLTPAGLPPLVRQLNLAVWFALGSGTFLLALAYPLLRRLRSADLAAAVGQQSPPLGGR